MFSGIDFFSDTLTKPTCEMKKAMCEAAVGDEQKGEDPTTNKLEEMVANILGFETSLFFPSATMCNQVALKLHAEPGNELIAAANCHLFHAEAGGSAIHSGLMSRPIQTTTGIFSGNDVKKAFRSLSSPNYCISKIVSIENTTNYGGGVPWDLAEIRNVLSVSKELGLKSHLDGSRLFNAVVKTSTPAHEIAHGFDTVTICLSKGLGCPMGAVLAFAKKNFPQVRRLKQIFGGSMRQSGLLAAAGIYALENNIQRLQQDHENCVYLAKKIEEELPLLKIENPTPPTNMIFFAWQGKKLSSLQFSEMCLKNGVRFSMMDENRFRAVLHLNITRSDIDTAINILKDLCKKSEL